LRVNFFKNFRRPAN